MDAGGAWGRRIRIVGRGMGNYKDVTGVLGKTLTVYDLIVQLFKLYMKHGNVPVVVDSFISHGFVPANTPSLEWVKERNPDDDGLYIVYKDYNGNKMPVIYIGGDFASLNVRY